jgi:copper chaperone CopZ
MEQTFIVDNIKCGGCMNSIRTALQKMDEVSEVQIDLENETIHVKGNADRLLIISKLNALGYPEKGNNSMVKKAKSYMNCAIGKMSD